MDFEIIDNVLGDTISTGDIIFSDEKEYHQIRRVDEDAWDTIVFDTYNLSTGDEDAVLIDPNISYNVYRSF